MRLQSILTSLLLSAATVAATACGGSSAAKPTTPPGEKMAMPMCPAAVPGTSVNAEDTATGGALVFVTTGDAAEVRKRVDAMAKMHNEHHAAMGALPTGDEPSGDMAGMDHSKMAGGDMAGMDHSKMAGGDMAGMDHSKMAGGDMAGMDHSKMAGMMISVHSKAVAEDLEGGARLSFIAAPADVATLQGQLRMHAEHMASGSCPMMGDHE